MTQNQLNREVANATGESIRTVAQRGFGILQLTPTPTQDEQDREPLVVDWEELESRREIGHPVPLR